MGAIKQKVIKCIKHSEDVAAEYYKREIYDGDILNCYGIKKTDAAASNMKKIGQLFEMERGALASESNVEGDYPFVTAGTDWKTHCDFDHNCEALVYAVAASGSLGRSHYVKGKFIASNLCLILTPRDEENYPINLQFYNMYLNAIRKRVANQLADGTSKLTIAPEELMDYYIEYIPIEKQNEMVTRYKKRVAPLQRKLKREQAEMERLIKEMI